MNNILGAEEEALYAVWKLITKCIFISANYEHFSAVSNNLLRKSKYLLSSLLLFVAISLFPHCSETVQKAERSGLNLADVSAASWQCRGLDDTTFKCSSLCWFGHCPEDSIQLLKDVLCYCTEMLLILLFLVKEIDKRQRVLLHGCGHGAEAWSRGRGGMSVYGVLAV